MASTTRSTSSSTSTSRRHGRRNRARCRRATSRDVVAHRAREHASTTIVTHVNERATTTTAEAWYDVARARKANASTNDIGELANEGKGTKIYVIPGNPGCAKYYDAFARELFEAFDGTRDVDVVGYVGHAALASPSTANARMWFTLDEQHAHVEAYIARDRARREQEGGGKICADCAVGHSIGARVALRARYALGAENIDVVVGLMPFLHVNTKSAKQRALSFLTRLTLVVHVVGALMDALRVAAPRVRALVVASVTRGMDAAARDITDSWLQWRTLINMAFMGRTEFAALVHSVDTCALVANASKRCALVYALDDHWAPLHQHDALKNISKSKLDIDVSIVRDPSVSHDFVVRDASAKLMAKRAATLIREREAASA